MKTYTDRRLTEVAETAAEVAMNIGVLTVSGRFPKWSSRYANSQERIARIAECAKMLESEKIGLKIRWGENAEWIDTCEDLANKLVDEFKGLEIVDVVAVLKANKTE